MRTDSLCEKGIRDGQVEVDAPRPSENGTGCFRKRRYDKSGPSLAGNCEFFCIRRFCGWKASSSESQEPKPEGSSPRERLLMDFGWRFHLGNACDPARDFGLGAPSWDAAFAKTGGMPKRLK